MIDLRRILVAYDFSPPSVVAARYALRLARDRQATVRLLTVNIAQEYLSDLHDQAAETDPHLYELTERLQSAAKRLYTETGSSGRELSIEQTIVSDVAPAPAIVQYAEEHDFSLIVMGTHGRRGVRRALLGSVASSVVRTAPCPVLAVRSGIERIPRIPRKILVPVDFSDTSREAVRYAAALSEMLGAKLHVINVLEDVNSEELYGFKPSIFGASEGYKYTRERLRRLCARLDVDASIHVLNGIPAEEITTFAARKGFDLIVMSTSGRSGVQRLLLGSVAEKVIATAPCPVLSARRFAGFLLPKDDHESLPERLALK